MLKIKLFTNVIKWAVFLCCLINSNFLKSQTINGNLSLLASKPIKLEGFNGLKTYPISSSTIDEKGNFKLSYSTTDVGVGYLKISDSKPIFVMLSGEEIEIVGEYLDAEKIRISKGKENQLFETYAKEQPRREQTLSAWAYLEKIYQSDSLFSIHKIPSQAIIAEKKRIKSEGELFLQSLPEGSYVKWFLPIRKLVSNVSVLAQYRPKEIPSAIAAFRALDYSDPRLYKSGLFKDAIESHFWLLENSGKPLDSVFIEMKTSIDAMMGHLIKDEKKLNEVTDYLFDLLERQSLFQASEYLALKALNETSCTLNSDLAKQLETYRAMKKGNIAPEILFTSNILAPNYANTKLPEKLSDLKNKYTVVVFGASWCPKCKEELPEIAKQYEKWNTNGVEVVFVSLDEDQAAYQAFAKDFPFISTCDFKKWESKIAKDYYIFGTPTMFLIDQNRKIILRPTSVKQMDAWVDWYLVQGNPLPK
jgi:thiol-disulfide isomerase/thioredoxin